MLKEILSIAGKPGLFKLVSRGNNMLIVESLLDGKRMPTYTRDKVVSLGDISMFTEDEDVTLWQVLENLKQVCKAEACTADVKNMSRDRLFEFFAEVLPNFDRNRVYPTDIRKLVAWYNLLVQAGITDFQEQEEEAASPEGEPAAAAE